MNSDDKKLYNFLCNHISKRPVSFHMPGHKGRDLFKQYNLADIGALLPLGDITEIPGADNLFSPDGVLLSGQAKYAELYGSKKSFYSINGSSAGIMAAVFSACHNGGKAIVSRNCHRAVFNAMRLWNISPVYVYPSAVNPFESRIYPTQIEKLLKAHPDTEAVIITSPDYYGNCSDIKTIADIVHKSGAYLIVDEAHGAHLTLFHKLTKIDKKLNLPFGALEQGADFVINSTHKTLASFTQSALLNVNTEKIPERILLDRLQLVESSSPSYILMASLELNAILLEEKGAQLFQSWLTDLNWFYEKVSTLPDILIYKPNILYDFTKINLSVSGLSGTDLENELNKYGIFPELTSGNMVMFMTGIGNKRSDYEALLSALNKIVSSTKALPEALSNFDTGINPLQLDYTSAENTGDDSISSSNYLNLPAEVSSDVEIPVFSGIPKESTLLNYKDCAGYVSAISIVPYPPGIPIICPGEIISDKIIKTIESLIKDKVFISGIDKSGMIHVGKEASNDKQK